MEGEFLKDGILEGLKMEKQIHLIRHCEAQGQPPESPLTEKGHLQALELSELLSDIKVDRVVTSPFLRAIQSIEPLAKKLNLEVELDSRLSERVLSNKNLTDWMDKLHATFTDLEIKYEGGESSIEAMNRIVELVDEHLNSDVESTIIVTHGNIMSLLLKYYNKDFGFEQWQRLSNPDVFFYNIKIINSMLNVFGINKSLWFFL